jgi:hypothetical protein
MSDFETFQDYFVSLYQSAVVEIARQIDERPVESRSRQGLQISAVSALTDVAADIAATEYASRCGSPRKLSSVTARDLSKAEWGRLCAEFAMRYLKAQLAKDAAAIAQIDSELLAGVCDPAWAATIKEYLKYFGPRGDRKEIPYVRASAVGPKVIEMKANARVALVGDWGTGAQPAIQLLQQVSMAKPDILVHLGDIYYSGTPSECKSNFLDPIERVLRARGHDVKVYTLSGNHDMYSGGVGYYQLINALNQAPFTQTASFFCLRSPDERWQLLAMDTGLHDYSPTNVADVETYLESDELEWHCQRIDEFPGRTILLSHHQLFSAFSVIGAANEGKRSALNPKLYEAFTLLAKSKKIAAWFWGHEHTLSIYETFAGLERGRCLGHGAVPTSVMDKIYEPVDKLEEPPSLVAGTELAQVGGIYAHGWATLAFENGSCTATYFQDVGGRADQVFQERFS